MKVAHSQIWSVTLERFGQFISTANSATVAAITDQLVLWLGHRD